MKTFSVYVEGPTYEISEEEIWPDGDGPENPTAEDVVEEMLDYGSISMVIHDWNFDDGLRLYVDHLEVKE